MSRFLRRVVGQDDQTSGKEILSPAGGSSGRSSQKSSRAPSVAPTKELLLYPSSNCSVPPPQELSSEQERVVESVKTHLLELHKSLDEKDPDYVLWERRWIEDPMTAKRYGRAAKWDEVNAKKRAADTLEWRREWKPDLIKPGEVSREGETGKHIVSGFDKCGRPVLYLRPGRENTEPNPAQVRFLVFDLERAIDFCPPGQHKICLVIDYATATQQTQPSFATQRKVLSILQNHYPERLGHAIVVNVPLVLSTFFAAISPFLDPETRTKISMLRSPAQVKETIPVEMLDAEFGGTWRYEFQFDKYWHDLLDFCGIAEDGTRTHETRARTQADKGNAQVDNDHPDATTAPDDFTTARNDYDKETTPPSSGNVTQPVSSTASTQND